jgi:hypothetical protein
MPRRNYQHINSSTSTVNTSAVNTSTVDTSTSRHQPNPLLILATSNMSFISTWIVVAIIFISAVRWKKCACIWNKLLQRLPSRVPSPRNDSPRPATRSLKATQATKVRTNSTDPEDLDLYKGLYFKLHNLEQHPTVLTQARDVLISLFAEKLSETNGSGKGILSLETFDAGKLAAFLKAQDDDLSLRWESYLERRKSGGPREMLKDLDHAKWWLKQISPAKMVDGAWLGHIHKISTPFSLRPITKKAWQVMSEELGDGDLAKNHVFLWRDLMDDIKADLPAPHDEDFIHPRHQLDKSHIWKAATAQLLISIFPHEFLPEILGFNLQYEMLTWDTMRAIKELKELKLNDYYFLLHISIDNADSGHTAMAMHAVISYMTHLQETEDEATVQQAWKRIQTGFILSERLPTSPDAEIVDQATHGDSSQLEAQVLTIFKAKAAVSHKLHCASRVKIKGRKLADWLDPASFESAEWQQDFIKALVDSNAWIRQGDSAGSGLMRLLAWDGKMFGAFTQMEVEVVRRWIDSLGGSVVADAKTYWDFTGRKSVSSAIAFQDLDIRSDYPVFSTVIESPDSPSKMLSMTELNASIGRSAKVNITALLPLWFAHASILEGFVATPSRTMTVSAGAVIRVLRAQYGFEAEGEGVAGTDEYNRTECIDLVDIGREMMSRADLPAATCIKDILQHESDSSAAIKLMDLSMRPVEQRERLLGMAWAFVSLHEFLARSQHVGILSDKSRAALDDIAVRERVGLQVCLDEISKDDSAFAKFCDGFTLARRGIMACVDGDDD